MDQKRYRRTSDYSGKKRKPSAFSLWMRTGRWPRSEQKFNPYHDPRNGQFTFAPGGPRSLSYVIHSKDGFRQYLSEPENTRTPGRGADHEEVTAPAVIWRGRAQNESSRAALELTNGRRASRGSLRSGTGVPGNALVIEELVPSLAHSPAGTLVSLVDLFTGITQPASELTAALTQAQTSELIRQIQVLEPDYQFESLGFPRTIEGQANQIRLLQFRRAAAFARARGEMRPLALEVLKMMQDEADNAYAAGLKMIEGGSLPIKVSAELTLGNFVDRRVRATLRSRLMLAGLREAPGGPISVNRREYLTHDSERSYRLPDARIGDYAFDVTLSAKGFETPQVQGYFGAKFRPSYVFIIRPKALGGVHSYALTKPEQK